MCIHSVEPTTCKHCDYNQMHSRLKQFEKRSLLQGFLIRNFNHFEWEDREELKKIIAEERFMDFEISKERDREILTLIDSSGVKLVPFVIFKNR